MSHKTSDISTLVSSVLWSSILRPKFKEIKGYAASSDSKQHSCSAQLLPNPFPEYMYIYIYFIFKLLELRKL